jgi:hypothetical protein
MRHAGVPLEVDVVNLELHEVADGRLTAAADTAAAES